MNSNSSTPNANNSASEQPKAPTNWEAKYKKEHERKKRLNKKKKKAFKKIKRLTKENRKLKTEMTKLKAKSFIREHDYF